jgi:DeoR/GlpR family transcriptional regulator of sugar metabolism
LGFTATQNSKLKTQNSKLKTQNSKLKTQNCISKETDLNFNLPHERRQYILDKLQADGKIIAAELSALYGVSEDTIRRDLRELAAAGLVKRVHGGALPLASQQSYTERAQHSTPAKVAIAQTAARLVQNGQVVILGSGTTNHEISKQLDPHLQATVITTSPPVALTLLAHRSVEVILVGGRLSKIVYAAIGAEALAEISRYHADICFLGICSLHPEAGYTANLFDEVAINRAIIAQSGEVVAAATADKLGAIAPYTVAPLSDITHLVTEPHLPEAVLLPYRQAGLEIVTA